MTPLQEHSGRSLDIHELLTADSLTKRFEIGLAVVDLRQKDVNNEYRIFGHNMNRLIYPASLSKIFIGAEVLRRVMVEDLDLDQRVEVRSQNHVDCDPKAFPNDHRRLLVAGDIVTIEELLDRMLSRSDNTASNELIDLVGRDAVNRNIITRNGWQGSEVTRKFLPRSSEEPAFRNVPITMSCPQHIADFFTRMAINPHALLRLQKYMRPQNSMWLPWYCCRKGGKHDSRLHDGRTAHWLHEAGIVAGRRSTYAVALMTLDKNDQPASTFPLRRLIATLHDYMESYKY